MRITREEQEEAKKIGTEFAKVSLYKKFLEYCKRNNLNIYKNGSVAKFKEHTKKVETIKSGLVEVLKVATGVASAYVFAVLFLCL